MWIWQLIIRRAKKVTIPLTNENCTPIVQTLTMKVANFSPIFLQTWRWSSADIAVAMVSDANTLL